MVPTLNAESPAGGVGYSTAMWQSGADPFLHVGVKHVHSAGGIRSNSERLKIPLFGATANTTRPAAAFWAKATKPCRDKTLCTSLLSSQDENGFKCSHLFP